MRFTDKALEKIERAYAEKRRASTNREWGLGVEVRNRKNGASVTVCGQLVCELDDLDQLIEELKMMQSVIEEEIGIC